MELVRRLVVISTVPEAALLIVAASVLDKPGCCADASALLARVEEVRALLVGHPAF